MCARCSALLVKEREHVLQGNAVRDSDVISDIVCVVVCCESCVEKE